MMPGHIKYTAVSAAAIAIAMAQPLHARSAAALEAEAASVSSIVFPPGTIEAEIDVEPTLTAHASEKAYDLVASSSNLQTGMDAQRKADASAVQSAAKSPKSFESAPISELIKGLDMPYEEFTLDNGLRVIVHTDRKAPVVAVSVWYGVGSKHEPQGKSGFAHLFEHLAFNGSENAPNDIFLALQQVGATDDNGSTWFDRSAYYETVPTVALDTALMLESDRMGYLLGAVSQEKLDNQIAVVQNEKRQRDDAPYGMLRYEQIQNLYPEGHPYHHATIGSHEDLGNATLGDVHDWFIENYGPNNAVLALAGDIDLETAKEKVTAWFGDIPRGPDVKPVEAPIPDAPQIASKTVYDNVPTTRVYRIWAVPGQDNPEYVPLALGTMALGRLAASRLEQALVDEQKLAIRVWSSPQMVAQAGQVLVYADAAAGVSTDELREALDKEIARFLEEGPTEEELHRATTRFVGNTIRDLEAVGGERGKAGTLAKGALYVGDPEQYRKELEHAAAATPAEVKEITAKWLSRKPFELIIKPGTRGGANSGGDESEDDIDGEGGNAYDPDAEIVQAEYYRNPALVGTSFIADVAWNDRSVVPMPAEVPEVEFPDIKRGQLSNGIPVYFAMRESVPLVNFEVQFDAGAAADPVDKRGIQSLMTAAMEGGTNTLDSRQLGVAKERLGIEMGSKSISDRTSFFADALEPNMEGSLALLADYIRNPSFEQSEFDHAQTVQVNRVKSELRNPRRVANRAFRKALYGKQHPYSALDNGLGSVSTLKNITRDDVAEFHQKWIRPEKAKIIVVGNSSMETVMEMLEKSFGDWQPSSTPAGQKDFSAPLPEQSRRILLIDRPNSSQSVIVGGRRMRYDGDDDLLETFAANTVYGGNYLSRINTNLRETKGWSYGVRSQIFQFDKSSAFWIYAPVQSDRTADSIVELVSDLNHFTSDEGVTEDELTRIRHERIRALPGRFEKSESVLNGVSQILTRARPDDYYENLDRQYSELTIESIDEAAQRDFTSEDMVFVVVGDAKTVLPQLDKLGIPVETVDPSEL